MMNADSVEQLLSRKIQRFTLISRYLGPSLANRVRDNHWYENRVIRYILKDSPWIGDVLEVTFQEAQLDRVPNSSEIFSALQGTEPDYDERLFDALAEVRLARWARLNGYSNIVKLRLVKSGRTPEFSMNLDGGVALAEAKHYRARDFLPSLVGERLEGLALRTGAQVAVDLWVNTTRKYEKERQCVTDPGQWIRRIREELTESWYLSLVQQPSLNSDKEVLDGLLNLEMTEGQGIVIPSWGGNLNPLKTAEHFLKRLEYDFVDKLAQIKGFINREQIGATQAIVFFSGTDPWNIEWGILWEKVEAEKDPSQWPWNRIRAMYEEAKSLIARERQSVGVRTVPMETHLTLRKKGTIIGA